MFDLTGRRALVTGSGQGVGLAAALAGAGATIVLNGRDAAKLGRPGVAPCVASKGAVKTVAKGICADSARHGLQVNGLKPGYFQTELTADRRFSDWLCKRTSAGLWGRVEKPGGAVVFLASAALGFVNGQVIYVDGGLTSVV